MTKEASNTHKQFCEFPCPFECGCKVTISSIKGHAPQNCPKCINKCCYSEFGCPWCGPGGSEYQIHLQNCKLAQLGPLYKMISALASKVDQMELKLDSKMDEIDTKMVKM